MSFDIRLPASLRGPGDPDRDALDEWVEDCFLAFENSPEYEACQQAGEWDLISFVDVIELGITEIGRGPAELDWKDLEFVLLELAPRLPAGEPEAIPRLLGSLKAFAAWMDREFGLAKSLEWAPAFTDAFAATLRERLAGSGSFDFAGSEGLLDEANGLSAAEELWLFDAREARRLALQEARKKKARRKAQKKARRRNRKKR